ncbi:hypothetical protein ACFL1B_06345 [Nanoarchaeota archaeon]
MDKRGAYFFVIDAFIGGAIVLISLIVVINSFTSTQDRTHPILILEDFVTYMSNTQVRDFQGTYMEQLIQQGKITNLRHTLLEQIGELHYYGNNTEAGLFIDEISDATLPEQMSFRYFYGNDMLHERAIYPYNKANLVLSSKKVSMVTINKSKIHGPHLAEVILWTS